MPNFVEILPRGFSGHDAQTPDQSAAAPMPTTIRTCRGRSRRCRRFSRTATRSQPHHHPRDQFIYSVTGRDARAHRDAKPGSCRRIARSICRRAPNIRSAFAGCVDDEHALYRAAGARRSAGCADRAGSLAAVARTGPGADRRAGGLRRTGTRRRARVSDLSARSRGRAACRWSSRCRAIRDCCGSATRCWPIRPAAARWMTGPTTAGASVRTLARLFDEELGVELCRVASARAVSQRAGIHRRR